MSALVQKSNPAFRIVVGAGIVMIAVIGNPAGVHAGDPRSPRNPKATEYLKEGVAFFKKGDSKTAIQLWEKGLTIEEAPWLLWNLSIAHEKQGELKKAVRYLERLAASDRLNKAQRKQIRERAAKLRERLPVEPEWSRKPTTKPRMPAPRRGAKPLAPRSPKATRRDSGRFRDKVPWLLIGGGTILGIAAGGFGLSASGLEAAANRESDDEERTRLRDLADSRRTTSVVLAVGGLFLIAAGITKFAIYKRKNSPQTARVGVVFGPRMIGLQGRF